MRLSWYCLLAFLATPPILAAGLEITPADPGLGRPVEFYSDVFPVLEAKCLACHNVRTKSGQLVLENITALLQGGESGPSLVPGKPDDSLLYRLAARVDEPVMPPLTNPVRAQPLTPRELGILRQWIQEGAAGGSPPPATSITWRPLPAHINSVQSLALDGSTRFLAAGRANQVLLYDLTEQREVARLTDPALLSLQWNGRPMYGPGTAHQDLVHALAFSPDGRLLASAGYREVKLWERLAETRLAEWDAGAEVSALAVAPDGVWAATGLVDGTIHLWNLSSAQPGPVLTGHSARVRAVAFTPDGASLISGGDDKTLRQWQLSDGSAAGVRSTPSETTALLIAKDGSQFLAAQQDHVLRIWDRSVFAATESPAAEPPPPVREIRQHGQPVTHMCWVADTDEFVTACRDGNVRLLQFSSGNQVRSFGLGAPVLDVAVSPAGDRVAACGENGVTRIWRRDNGSQLAEIKGDLTLAARVLALQDEQTVAKLKVGLRNEDQQAAEKDLKEREDSLKKANELKETAVKGLVDPEKKFQEADAKAQQAAQALADKPDDESLKKARDAADKARTEAEAALKKAQDALASAERAIKLSEESLSRARENLERSRQAHEAAQQSAAQVDEQLKAAQTAAGAATGPYRGLAFSPGGGQLVGGGAEGRLDVWNASSGAALESLTAQGPLLFIRYAPSGTLVTVSGSQVVVRDVSPRWRLAGRLGPPDGSPLDVAASPMVDRILTLCFSPDGQRLATGGGDPSRSGELLLWDVATRSVVREFKDAHSDTVCDLEFSRDGQRLVTGAADKFVKLWNVETGALERSYEGHTNQVLAVAIKCDDSSLVSGGADHAIKVWNLATGEQRRTINSFGKQVTALDYIGTSDNLVASGGDKTVRLFTANNGNNFRTYGGLPDYAYDALASRDQQLVIGAGEDGVIHVWNGQNGNELFQWRPAPRDADAAPVAVR